MGIFVRFSHGLVTKCCLLQFVWSESLYDVPSSLNIVSCNHEAIDGATILVPWASWQVHKIAHAPGMPGAFSPATEC